MGHIIRDLDSDSTWFDKVLNLLFESGSAAFLVSKVRKHDSTFQFDRNSFHGVSGDNSCDLSIPLRTLIRQDYKIKSVFDR